MFFQLLPTVPPAAVTAPIVEIVAECKKGSRDCFPEDRVGVAVETAKTTVLDPAGTVAVVFHPTAIA